MVPIWKGAGAAGANRVGLSNPPPSDGASSLVLQTSTYHCTDWRQFANLQSGAQLDISEPWTPGTAYTVVTPDFSLATQHEYELDWQTDHISVSVDGSLVAKYTRDKSAAWPEEFLVRSLFPMLRYELLKNCSRSISGAHYSRIRWAAS